MAGIERAVTMTLDLPHDIRNATINDAEPVAELISQLGYPATAIAMRDRLDAIRHDPAYLTLVSSVQPREAIKRRAPPTWRVTLFASSATPLCSVDFLA